MAIRMIGPSGRNKPPASRDGTGAPQSENRDGQAPDEQASHWSEVDSTARSHQAPPNGLRRALQRASAEEGDTQWAGDPGAQPARGDQPRGPRQGDLSAPMRQSAMSLQEALQRASPADSDTQKAGDPGAQPARGGQPRGPRQGDLSAPIHQPAMSLPAVSLQDMLRQASAEDAAGQWPDDHAPRRPQDDPRRERPQPAPAGPQRQAPPSRPPRTASPVASQRPDDKPPQLPQ